jgi:preprotein translocase subunit SecG
MGRNEIRLRRQLMSTGRIARHRNYSELMRQHDRDTKLKRVLRVFYYFLVALFLVIILIIVIRWEKRSSKKTAYTTEIFNKNKIQT